MMRWTLRFVLCAAAVVAGTLVLQADDKITAGDAELQFQLGNLLSEFNFKRKPRPPLILPTRPSPGYRPAAARG